MSTISCISSDSYYTVYLPFLTQSVSHVMFVFLSVIRFLLAQSVSTATAWFLLPCYAHPEFCPTSVASIQWYQPLTVLVRVLGSLLNHPVCVFVCVVIQIMCVVRPLVVLCFLCWSEGLSAHPVRRQTNCNRAGTLLGNGRRPSSYSHQAHHTQLILYFSNYYFNCCQSDHTLAILCCQSCTVVILLLPPGALRLEIIWRMLLLQVAGSLKQAEEQSVSRWIQRERQWLNESAPEASIKREGPTSIPPCCGSFPTFERRNNRAAWFQLFVLAKGRKGWLGIHGGGKSKDFCNLETRLHP